MSWAAIRTRLPARRTLPSSTDATPRSSAISRTLFVVSLYRMTDVRLITLSPSTGASTVRISSVIPSLKYSFSGSALRLAKGRTAIERGADSPPADDAAGRRSGAVGSRVAPGFSSPTRYTSMGAASPLKRRSPRDSKRNPARWRS